MSEQEYGALIHLNSALISLILVPQMQQSKIDLNTLKTLVDVVAAGSFAAAARERGVPPNKLSRQVQRLERDLGIRLLQRSTRRLGLTSPGRELVEAAKSNLAELEQHLEAISSHAKEPRGHLRVAAPTSFFEVASPGRIASFLEQYPHISLEFLLSDEHVDLIDGGIDLAIRAGVIRDETLIARRLAESRRIVVASPTCIARHGAPQSPQALSKFPCLAARGRNGFAVWQLTGPRGTVQIEVPARLTANGTGALIAAAKFGLGAALVPRVLVEPALQEGSLVQLMDRYHGYSPGVFAVYPSRMHSSAALEAFIAFLLEEAVKLRP